MTVNNQTYDRYVATEEYVRGVLRIMGQPDDADNPRLVGRIVSKILRALLVWAHPDLPLRLTDEELEQGNA